MKIRSNARLPSARAMQHTALAFGLVMPLSLHAEQAADENTEEEELPAMTVTATRVASEVQDTPSAVTIVNEKELDTVKFVDSRTELMKRIPGYSMVRNFRIPMGGKNYTINLIDGLSIGSAFGSGSIGFAEDTNTMDIERIEVIRGPASALYGSNALGGVINIITREPPLEPEYRAWGELGDYDRKRGGISTAGTAKGVGYFLDANVVDLDGAGERTRNERQQLSGKLVFTPDDASSLTVRGEYLDTYVENPGTLSETEYRDDWQQAAVDDAYNDEQAGTFSAKYERDINDYSGFEVSYGVRNTRSEGPPSYSATGGFSSSDVTNHNVVALYRHDFDVMDSQFIVGADLLKSLSDSDTYSGRTTDTSIAQHWELTATGTSPFAQYEFSPAEWVRVSLGARYDRIEYAAKGYKVSTWPVVSTTYYDESVSFSHVSPKAGVTFKLDPDNSLWVGYGQGFVVPSRTYLFVGSRGYVANPDLNPEKADNYEIGFRGRLREAHLSYDFALYHTEITDMLVADDSLVPKAYVNAGKARVQGLETLINWKPLKTWRFGLTHTYAENKYLDFVTGTSDYSGNTMAYSPKHHFDVRATWLPIHGLEAELEWNHISGYETTNANDDPGGMAKRSDMLNLRVSYKQGQWSLWGHMLNLTDEKYAERVSYSSSSGRSYTVGIPRTIYAGAAYNW